MNTIFFIINVVTVAFIAALVAVTPALNRKSLLFGVRVPEDAAALPESRRLRRNYLTIVTAGSLTVLGAATAQYLTMPGLSLLALLYFPFVMVGVQFAAFLPQWKKAKALKAQKGWEVPLTGLAETRSSADREKLSSLPWGWYIAGAALVLAAVVWTFAVYPNLPDIIPTHWDARMQPDAWGEKSVTTLMLMPLIALGTVAMMAGVNVMIYKQKLQVSAEYPALSFAQHRMYRRMLSRALGFMTLCMAVMFVMIQLPALDLFMPPPAYLTAVMTLIGIGMVPVICVPFRAGQSGCKLRPTVEAADALTEQSSAQIKVAHPGRGDDQYWKLGMFYYNPDDPAVLVEDRFGGNSGFNYARPASKAVVAAGVIVLIASYIVITYMVFRYPLG